MTAAQRRTRYLRPAREEEVTQGAALHPDEEPVDLKERREESDCRPLPARRPRRPVPGEMPLIDVAMVERRDRESPRYAALDVEVGGRARTKQRVARIAADVSRPAVTRGETGPVPGG